MTDDEVGSRSRRRDVRFLRSGAVVPIRRRGGRISGIEIGNSM
nr:hypothetical protein JVH1_4363 [Rhodococcus sp. JVH1]